MKRTMRRLPFCKLIIVLAVAVLTGCGTNLSPTKEIVSETTDIKGGSWKTYEPQKCAIGSNLKPAPREALVAPMTKSRNLHRLELADLGQGMSKG